MSKKALASVARFAHLLGIQPRAEEPKDEDPDAPVQGEDESDEDFAQRCEEYEEEKKDKAKKAKKAEGDDKDPKADDEDAEGEDDSEEAKAARKSERARCARIFGCKAAAGRPDMAAHLAFETGMSASAAIKMLGAIAAGQPRGASLSSRMSGVALPIVSHEEPRGSATQQSAAAATAKAIVAAGARARGEKA